MANIFDQRRLQIEAMMNRMASNPNIPPQALEAMQAMQSRSATRSHPGFTGQPRQAWLDRRAMARPLAGLARRRGGV